MNSPHIVSIGLANDSKSPFWVAQWALSNGTRLKKSTKVPVAGGLFRGERLSRLQAKNRALAIAREIADESLEQTRKDAQLNSLDLFDLMLKGKLGRVSIATYENAKASYKFFTDWLGKKASAPINYITKATIKEWVLHRRSLVRHATCRKDLSAIRAAFEWAVDAEILDRNPCDKVSVPPDNKEEKVIHEAFTLEEIKLLLDKLPCEWATAMRCCLGTYGQRLGDVLNLRWDQFDFTSRTVTLVTGKTARILCQPMQEWFYLWAKENYKKEDKNWVCPNLRLLSSPSHEFTQLVRSHGIGLAGKNTTGRRRVWHSKTFHSLRASVATLLQAAGVSQGMAMQLVGHESSDIHSVYIRPSAEQLRTAAYAMPSIG